MLAATALRRARACTRVLLLLAAVHPRPAAADPHPLWEFGLGAGTVLFNDYRGADGAQAYVLPLPYFVYRGTSLKADRNGVRGLFYQHPRVELNISLNATVPVRSRSTGARSGMPALDPTVELGPSLDWHLWRSVAGRVRLDLRLPLRAAFTVGSHPRAIGWFAAPAAAVDLVPQSAGGWNVGTLAGPLFADRRYHSYFYDVAPAYATAARPAYAAAGGYSGAQALLAVSHHYHDFWVGAYVRHDWLAGAAFIRSPLVQQNSYWAGGIGVAWTIGQSSRQVDTDE
jgi:outer membrane scaffolding protein for murein synthesis (MipA/OmpV family)